METIKQIFDKPKEVIRTLGFYQPFGSLMLQGKIETRWVREGHKPPFPLGKYLFYTTKKSCDRETLYSWCGEEIMELISKKLHEPNVNYELQYMHGYAFATADLFAVKPLLPEEEESAFVKFIGKEIRKDKNGKEYTYIQWGLYFDNVKILPHVFKWNFGKQGIGFVPESELEKILRPEWITISSPFHPCSPPFSQGGIP